MGELASFPPAFGGGGFEQLLPYGFSGALGAPPPAMAQLMAQTQNLMADVQNKLATRSAQMMR